MGVIKSKKNKSKAYTLLEILIALSVLLIIFPAFFAIVISIFREQAKLLALQLEKREGDYAISFMTNKIRAKTEGVYNSSLATSAHQVCNISGSRLETDGSSIFFKTKQPSSYYVFNFRLKNNELHFITYDEQGNILGSSGDVPITSSKVKITNLQVSCEYKSSPFISFSFQIEPVSKQKIVNALQYQERVALKKF